MDWSTRGASLNPYQVALRGLRRGLWSAALFSALVNVLMLTGSLYMLQVYDRVLGSGSVPTLLGLFAIVVVLYGFLGFYDFLRTRILARCAVRLDLALGPQIFAGWMGSETGQAALARPLRDLETLRSFLSGPAVTALMDLPWIPLFLGILFVLHPWLGWLTVGGAIIAAVLALAMRMLTAGPISRAATLDAVERDFVEQGRGAAETIRAMGMAGWVTAAWQRHHQATLTTQQAAGNPAEMLSPASRAFRMLLQSSILTLGAYLVLQHELSAGMIIASSILSGRALAPVDQLIGQWRVIGRAIEAHHRLHDAFSTIKPEKARVQLPPPTGRITVNRLTKFAPGTPGTDRPRILTQVSFDLQPGDGLGVIGASASGKSTLARLLVGAWSQDAGEIRFDGATLDQWPADEIGRHIGYLPQQVRMLPGTIGENIARFDPEATDEAVIEAARLTGVHQMILALPDGYATRLGGATEPLSGGQIQRLGLARAIYRMPKIVVLDEPNSNLDAAGDDALTAAILTLRKAGSAVVVMAHRPSGLAAVNKVLVLQAGTVLGFGDKAEVLRATLEPRSLAAAPGAAGTIPASPSVRSIQQPAQQPRLASPAAAGPPNSPTPRFVRPKTGKAAPPASAPATPSTPAAAAGRGDGAAAKLPDRGSSVWPPLPPLPPTIADQLSKSTPGPQAQQRRPAGAESRPKPAQPPEELPRTETAPSIVQQKGVRLARLPERKLPAAEDEQWRAAAGAEARRPAVRD